MTERAIIYARVSLDRTGEAASVTRQQQDAAELAVLRGWTVVETLIDNDVSAAGKKRRPGFEALLEAIAGGRASVVVAWSLDRLTRNRRDTVRLIETCQAAAATIALVRGTDMDLATPSGRMVADILASVARNEIEVKSDRQTRATRQAAEAGRRVAGSRAFGYTLRCKDDCPLDHEHWGTTGDLEPDEAAAVRDAYGWLIDGVSVAEIARRWNARGLLTPANARTTGGNQWRSASVSTCLKKPRNAGLREYRGEIVAKATWPAIVDEETFYAARAILTDPTRRTRAENYRMHLLTGVARCGRCGSLVQSGSKNHATLYVCRKRDLKRYAEPIEAVVELTMVEALKRPEFARAFTTPSAEGGPSASELLAEADELRRRQEGLAVAYAEGVVTLAQLTKGTERLRKSITDVEARIQSADPVAGKMVMVASATDVEAAWRALPVLTRRRIIDRLAVVTIKPSRPGGAFDPESVSIEWRAS